MRRGEMLFEKEVEETRRIFGESHVNTMKAEHLLRQVRDMVALRVEMEKSEIFGELLKAREIPYWTKLSDIVEVAPGEFEVRVPPGPDDRPFSDFELPDDPTPYDRQFPRPDRRREEEG